MLALGRQALERRALARNEALFKQGDKVTAIYLSKRGGCGWTGVPSTVGR